MSIIMHNLCVFCTFSNFAQKIFKGWGCNFTWSFGKVMRIKSLLVFVARIVRHTLCMIYAYFDFFCSKIIFDQKLFSNCWDKFYYPGSIVYLSCFEFFGRESADSIKKYRCQYMFLDILEISRNSIVCV